MRFEKKANWLTSQPKKKLLTGLKNTEKSGYGILALKNHKK